jgi:hypothetical protein
MQLLSAVELRGESHARHVRPVAGSRVVLVARTGEAWFDCNPDSRTQNDALRVLRPFEMLWTSGYDDID